MIEFPNTASANSTRVLVTGATGALGPRVVEALYGAGYPVRVFAQDPPQKGELPDNIDVRTGDINNFDDILQAFEGIQIIVHMAAILHIVNPSPYQILAYKTVNVEGTRNVVEAAIEAGARRLLFFSTIAVYGSSHGSLVTEETSPRPDNHYAESKLHAERIVLGARLPGERPFGTVLRLAAVYGSRVKGNYRRLVQALANKKFVPLGYGRNRRTLIYDKDVGNSLLSILKTPNSIGKLYNVTDGQTHTLSEIIRTICEALGRKPPRIHLPVGPLRVGAGIVDKVAKFLSFGTPGFINGLNKYLEDLAVDGKRIQEETGFTPKYDLISGWKETVAEMRAKGEL